MNKQNLRSAFVSSLVPFLLAAAVSADAGDPFWLEAGDAGALPNEAQPALGVGPVALIQGQTGPGDFEDMYLIEIVDPDGFIASTNPFLLGGNATFDAQLFLFDSNGIGVAGNDDCPVDPGMGPGACIEGVGPLGLNLVQQPGLYYLAISGSDPSGTQNDPLSAGGPIFNQDPRNEVTGPDGPGGVDAIVGWTGGGELGSYQIRLAGAAFVVPPSPYEPGTKYNPFFAYEGVIRVDTTTMSDVYSSCAPSTFSTHVFGDDGLNLFLNSGIFLFNGEYNHNQIDLGIRGRGFDFAWARRYRSKLGPNTDMGNGWDHSYNIFLEPCGPHLILHDGHSREDLFLLQPDGSWTRKEFFGVITQNPDLSFSYTYPDANNMFLNGFVGNPDDGKLSRLVDRNGNEMTFTYGPAGKLVSIADTLNQPGNPRAIAIGYNPDGLISSVTDFTGRTVTYDYYEDGEVGGAARDLKSVTTPAVVGTPNGNDFPAGKTTTYTYTTGFADERLNHDLLTITDPKGQVYLQNVYAHTIDLVDPRHTTSDLDLNFDRVVRQQVGDPNGIIDFVYVEQIPDPINNLAVVKAIVNDRNGHVDERFYDGLNRCVITQEYTGVADPNQPTDDAANRPAAPLRAGDPLFFETRAEYNDDALPIRFVYPNLNEIICVYDEPNPSRRSQGNLLQRTALPGPLGGDQTQIDELFEYDDGGAGCCGTNFVTRHVDGRGNETLHEYDSVGNRTRTTHQIPSIVEDFEYNAFGQLTSRVLPDNGGGTQRVDTFTYYDSGPQTGYRESKNIDDAGFGLTTTYEYDNIGRVTRMIDPRGQDTIVDFNVLDQVVRTQSRDATGSGARYEKLRFYDANDNVIRVDVENVDEAGVQQPNTHFTTIYEYDILNAVTRRCNEVGDVVLGPTDFDCTSLPPADSIVTEFEYDANRNRVLERSGEATNGNQPTNAVRTLYDERDLVFQTIRAQGDADQSSTQYDYDGNRNVITLRGGLEDAPRVNSFQYDGYDRLTRMVDPMGNQETRNYDANSNRIFIRIDGEINDVVGDAANDRLFETTYEYDNMNRLTRTVSEFFDTETQAPIGDGQSTTDTTYSDNSQIVIRIDDNGHASTFTYDSANRLSTATDAKGNTTLYLYDQNSNVTRKEETDKSDLLNPDQLFGTTYEYDNLDRLTRCVDNVGNSSSARYDSRDNKTETEDPLGEITRYAYDGINRLTRTTLDLDGDGADGDGDDVVIIKVWDDSLRLIEETDDLLNSTTYEYDALNRMTRTVHADGTENNRTYDVHDNRTSSTDANGSSESCVYDGLDRLSGKTVIPGLGVSGDTTNETYVYDGLSRVVRAEDDDSVVTRAYDSLSHCIAETLNGQATTRVYDGVGNKTECVYPGGRTIDYTYDVLNRVQVINDGPLPIATYDYIGRNRVERRENGNGTRLDLTYDGITGVPNPPGDAGVRQVIGTAHSVIATGSGIDIRTFVWDPKGNKAERNDVLAGGPQLTHDYEYDSINRMTRTIVTNPSPADVRDTNYLYDGAGNRTSVSGEPNAGPYLLDGTLPTPADAQMNQYTATPFDTRQYDDNGNLILIHSALLPDHDGDGDVDLGDFSNFSLCFGGANNPPAASCPPGVDADYDNDNDVDLGDFSNFSLCFGGANNPPAGSCPFGQPTGAVQYNYRNQMVAYTNLVEGLTHTYAYDALGRRIARVVDTGGADEQTRYYYDGWTVCEEQDENGVTGATYLSGEDCNANGMDDPIDLLSVRRDGLDYYYHKDDLGNVMAVTDAAGAVVERYEYDDFGRPLIFDPAGAPRAESAVGNLHLFKSRRYDPETGWYYCGSRYLDPQAGRFTTRDAAGIWGNAAHLGNGSTFAGNNPWTGGGGINFVIDDDSVEIYDRDGNLVSISGVHTRDCGAGSNLLSERIIVIDDDSVEIYSVGQPSTTGEHFSNCPRDCGRPAPTRRMFSSTGFDGYLDVPHVTAGKGHLKHGWFGNACCVQYRETDFNFASRQMMPGWSFLPMISANSRVKVQFHWDREGKKDVNSSCWIRTAQMPRVPQLGDAVIMTPYLRGRGRTNALLFSIPMHKIPVDHGVARLDGALPSNSADGPMPQTREHILLAR